MKHGRAWYVCLKADSKSLYSAWQWQRGESNTCLSLEPLLFTSFKIVVNINNIKFPISTIVKLQVNGIKYIHNVV